MTSLKDKITSCVKTHYEDETNRPVNIIDVMLSIVVLLTAVEVYYKNLEKQAERLDPNTNLETKIPETKEFIYIQQVIVKKMMEDLTGMIRNQENSFLP